MRSLQVERAEAESIFESDRAIDREEAQDFDLSPEKEKIAKKFAHTGTREVKSKPVYNFKQKERKKDVTKEGIIAEMASFLEASSQFAVEGLTIPNKQGKISFSIGDENFSITLTRHNKKK